MTSNPIRNIDSAELMDFMSPKGKFAAKLCRMGPSIGAEKLVNVSLEGSVG